jgi:hypothetical protein
VLTTKHLGIARGRCPCLLARTSGHPQADLNGCLSLANFNASLAAKEVDTTTVWSHLMTHKYRGCIVVLSINKSVEPNEEQKVLTSGFDQGFTVNTSKRGFKGIW